MAGLLANRSLKTRVRSALLFCAGVAGAAHFFTYNANAEDWLPPGSTTDMKLDRPAELIKAGTKRDAQFLYGRLLFRSPEILGEKAIRIGLSCDSCHTNGHINSSFYIDGLSDQPGRIDVSHRFWKAGFDDGKDNPIDIPTLRGIADTAPYGTVRVFEDLPAFTQHVTVTEFGGRALRPDQMQALISYMNALDTDRGEDPQADKEVSDMLSYLPLLEGPIREGDKQLTLELLDLIRADLGRHLTEENQQQSEQDVRMMILIKKAVHNNRFDQALAIYRNGRS